MRLRSVDLRILLAVRYLVGSQRKREGVKAVDISMVLGVHVRAVRYALRRLCRYGLIARHYTRYALTDQARSVFGAGRLEIRACPHCGVLHVCCPGSREDSTERARVGTNQFMALLERAISLRRLGDLACYGRGQ